MPDATWFNMKITEKGKVFFVNVVFVENDADDGAEEEGGGAC